MKLHIGCGNKILKGWINCDAQAAQGVDIVSAFEDLKFESNSVDEIYACHILEHFGRHTYSEVLEKMFGWLKPNGKLWLAVPDFEACVEHYKGNKDIDALLGLLMGGQKDSYDFHKMIFDYRKLESILRKIGFKSISRYDRSEHDVSKQEIDDFSAAYLPHMDPHGRLMSLNVVSVK